MVEYRKACAKKDLRILLIGHSASHVSGSALLFKQLVEALRQIDRVQATLVNTVRPATLTSNRLVNFIVALKVTLAVLFYVARVDVITFHASCPAMMLYGPLLFLIARLFHKPLILRLFGGAMEEEYERLSTLRRRIFDRTVLSADLFLMETKHLVSYFRERSVRNAKWYPNSREIIDLPSCKGEGTRSCERFLFLGRVIEEKGIGLILESIPYLMPKVSVDIFGSLDGHYSAEHINVLGKGVVRYGGVLTAAEVQRELSAHDALILPTFYHAEGYPGVILEAYNHGLPVVASQWRSIPEIVDGTSGILILPHSAEALTHAMNMLHTDKELYSRLRQGALTKRLEFSDRIWADRFIEWCTKLATGPSSP